MLIRKCAPEELPRVQKMSDALVTEGILNGMVRDTLEYLSEYDIDLLFDDVGELIGYAYGSIAACERDKTYVRKGDKIFTIEEIYIAPDRRGRGFGKALYRHLEEKAKAAGCALIDLNAVSRGYRSLLHFYIDELGMEFWSAYLIKRL